MIQCVTAGMLGQKNTKRGMSFSAKETAITLANIMNILGTKYIENIYTSGLNKNNKTFSIVGINSIFTLKQIHQIIDITPKKFNGPRAKGRRRV